jgi:hypothetical protein
MFIRVVDESLERLLRAELPLPAEVGDVSFEQPTGTWSAQLSRLTVNLFLYDVGRSTQPSRSPMRRVAEDGTGQRRVPLPMVRLGYLVSAWAGSPRDEHQLLGEVINRLAGLPGLPERYLPEQIGTSIDLSFGEDEQNRLRDLWTAVGGQLKASFTLQVHLPADAFGWTAEAPAVAEVLTRMSGLTPPSS